MNAINHLAQGSIVSFDAQHFTQQLQSGQWQWYNTSKDGLHAYIRKLGKKGQVLSPNAVNMTSISVEALETGLLGGYVKLHVGVNVR